ncbi:hypothetical protein LU631_02475 [Erwinia tracheiphila]|uniref:Uncharacterized protein n=1 Tax=Erwinia tracheiphila TaxID=65700 RepID=A0A0M2KC86_9GAMM|nr:hypothetical protein [Erwinia tracheiphila]AXF76102.1 hypothetical protein AV903_08630 [Erwinia tracheiphila]EOS94694.1 hypothetical protein ETR_12293 [Erwinia tracheiphila PSU-1]KKF36970.1 hypothetical protein SY86_18540 [Erwinia tracheiphila]UIA85234.1 hypothetical protein LU604_10635 [Erwinia tracheiphila]UIA88316.1 hypothetical protein LU631_02475 [Erwinia tracheiphila]
MTTFADPADEAAARQQQMIDNALANRKLPAPPSPVCRNGDCGEKSQPGTSYYSSECREDAERLARAEQQRRVA